MEKWENLLDKIKNESDPKKLHQIYHLQDNFIFLVTINSSQKEALESMLELYPKGKHFKKNFDMFGIKYYEVGKTYIGYRPGRSSGFVEWFEHSSGESSSSNASISFHPTDGTYEGQIISGKNAVIEISKKLMELEIPFESAVPGSRYLPIKE